MLRLFSLVGVAFLAAAAVAMTSPTTAKIARRERRLPATVPNRAQGLQVALTAPGRPLYYARFSLN